MPVYKRGRVWWVTISHGGKRIRRPAGSNADAKALEARIREDIRCQRLGIKPPRQLDEALRQWLQGECARLKSSGKFMSHARALRPYVIGKPMSAAPQAARDMASDMLARGLSATTVNRRIAILRRICNLAYREWGWLDAPIGDRVKLLSERSERHIYLTPAEVSRLAEACPNPAAGDMVRLAALTGLRRGELFGLTQPNVRDGCIVLDAHTKTGRPRVVPIPREAQEIASRLPLPVTDGVLRRSWDVARKAAGLEHVRFHDLRHTYASWLVQAGVPLRAVQDLLGHSTLTMTQRYAHLGAEHLHLAVEKMAVTILAQSAQEKPAKKGALSD